MVVGLHANADDFLSRTGHGNSPGHTFIDGSGRQTVPDHQHRSIRSRTFDYPRRISRPGRKAASIEALFQACPDENTAKTGFSGQDCGERRNLNLPHGRVNMPEKSA
jgi:hypothetical protein